MKQQFDEKYYFFRLYLMNFETVLESIRILHRYKRRDIRNCVIRDIVVSYARGFSGNKGTDIKNHMLTEKFIPKNLLSLHKELIDDRKKLFAHTDYTYYNPKAVNWSTIGQKWFPMSYRAFDYSQIDKQIPQIENLVKSIIKNLQMEIDLMEDKFQIVSAHQEINKL